MAPRVVNMVPEIFEYEDEADSEPFLGVSAVEPNVMVATAFTANPDGLPSAPLYVTEDCGESWYLLNVLASEVAHKDATIAMSGRLAKRAFASLLLNEMAGLVMSKQKSDDITVGVIMAKLKPSDGKDYVDQPYVAVSGISTSADGVYVGYNHKTAADGRTATLEVSRNDGADFTTVAIEHRSTPGKDGAPVRPSVAKDGKVYAAFFGWRETFTSNSDDVVAQTDIVVVRDDHWGAGSQEHPPFEALTDSTDSEVGQIVASTNVLVNSMKSNLGCERVGSALALAVDPNNSSVVYVAWGDRSNLQNVQNLHVRRSIDSGQTWSTDLRTVLGANNPALAISPSGTVGFAYQDYDVAGDDWRTVLEQSKDAFVTRSTTVLAKTADDPPGCRPLPYLGDYLGLIAGSGWFRGTFGAANDPATVHFPSGVKYQRPIVNGKLIESSGSEVEVSIDPYFFEVPDIQ